MTKRWENVGSLYQIYPRSYQDTDGDGVGDLRGITRRLSYLENLGIDAVWISPFFPSPQTDFGYDVSDYRDIDPTYGTLDDFRELLKEAKARNIKVMIDLVPCHSSDQHEWFKESSSSRDNPKRDYYVWRDASPDDGAPNNWVSLAGGSSWAYDETTGQYYLHSFLSSQPDLNWDNPVVRQEMTDVVRFWFEMGVDGLRVDAIWGISKDPLFGDDSHNYEHTGAPDVYGAFVHDHCKFGPNFNGYLAELASVCDEFDDKQIVFEFYPDERLGDIYDQYAKVAHIHPKASVFYMEHRQNHWHASDVMSSIDRYTNYSTDEAKPFFCLGNHDQPRVVSRLGEARARALNFLNLTTPGISVVYYGDEIGMENAELAPTEIQDAFSPASSIFDSRDLERTPMQWDGSLYGGFSETKPWLPTHRNTQTVNVETESAQLTSMLEMHRLLLKLRQAHPLLVHGTLERVDVDNGFVVSFKREYDNQRAYILVNFSSESEWVKLPESCNIIASTSNWLDLGQGLDIKLPAYFGLLAIATN